MQRKADVTESSVFAASVLRDAAPPLHGPTVLIAEDNAFNRSVLRVQLAKLGATVLEAADGEEAFDILKKRRVDAVLTDISMPKMTGVELLAHARALDPAMRIYAVSASTSPQDVARGRARGFTDYLTKPVSLAVLSKVLKVSSEPLTRTEHQEDLPPRFPGVPFAFARAFVHQIDEDVAALDAISKTRDTQKLHRWGHKVSGGLSVLGPSMLLDQCEELRAVLRETGEWVEDVDTFVESIRADLIEMRAQQHAALQP
ncbi:response regulator [Caballeronia sp. BR00000012568055]|uniref:response regulator n=1 Tax=Caballeronia sp. BR00000012568055 TaxID=2918761 RepID=UPI0023F771BC|nr:response regulator [Caballeronia sp. BR00000012568055]